MRHPNPGDKPIRYRLQDERQVHNRVHVGQILSVDPGRGTCKVAVHGTPQEFTAVIPTQAISLNQANGFKSSWQRYMPQRYSFVKIGYGLDNRPQLLGMATWGHAGSTNGPYIAGYAQVQERANRSEDGLSDFVELQEGEWDMRSSGNAYLHGSNKGRLLLAGGAVRMELRKEEDEFDLRSSLTRITNGAGSTIRLGTIKRALGPSAFTETEIDGSTNEYSVRVETGGLASLPMYESRLGDVRNSFGVPEIGIAPLRARYSYYDVSGLVKAFEATVDQLGNVDAVHGPIATSGLSLSGTTGSLNTQYLNTEINSFVTTTISSTARTTVSSLNPIGGIAIGSDAATNRMILSTVFLTTYLPIMAQISALTPIAPLLQTALGKIPQLSQDETTAVAAFGQLLTTIATAATAHTTAAAVPGPVGWLSSKVFTE